jgi:hypothetical protein
MSTSHSHDPRQYQIRIKGHLPFRRAAWFDGMNLASESGGTALLSGSVVDQSAMHAVLR